VAIASGDVRPAGDPVKPSASPRRPRSRRSASRCSEDATDTSIRYHRRVTRHALSSLSLLALVVSACGGAASESPDEEPVTVSAAATDSAGFLLEVGGTLSEVLTEPQGTIDDLEAARRAARGVDRLRAQRDLARAHLFAGEHSEGREQRNHYREMNELTTTSTRVRDEQLASDLDFLALWASWRGGMRNADARAQRFVDRHATSPDLVLIAWIIRGEIAFEAHAWDDALECYRAVLGRLGHPLYAFALYRSARVWHEQGREDDAQQALREVRDLGCGTDVSPATLHIANASAHALGEQTAPDTSGRERPASCPEGGVPTTAGPLEDERPPVLQ
jgi:hypothetical protein